MGDNDNDDDDDNDNNYRIERRRVVAKATRRLKNVTEVEVYMHLKTKQKAVI